MTATRHDIKDYIEQCQAAGARWVIIAVDRFDHDNYPIFVMEDDDFYEKLPNGDNMQGYDEVYDLEMDIDEQLAEYRAIHMPKRE